jgi:molybdenum cofactor biosynthesis enzyme MoaA
MNTGQNDHIGADPDPNEPGPATNAEPRFCSSCSRTKAVKGGALVRCANGAKRWKCADCLARSKAHLASRDSRGTRASQDPI